MAPRAVPMSRSALAEAPPEPRRHRLRALRTIRGVGVVRWNARGRAPWPMTEVDIPVDISELSDQLAGRVVAELAQPNPDMILLRFTDGEALAIRPVDEGVEVVLQRPRGGRGGGSNATRRQREYLQFIKRYMHRFGVAPAEADIQRHFLVSAPSVNQMIRTLERRGFISRDRDSFGKTVPRSIRVIWED